MSADRDKWVRRGVFENDRGRVVKQSRRGTRRLRVELHGSQDPDSWIYLTPDELFDLAELLDDACDAAEDLTFPVD